MVRPREEKGTGMPGGKDGVEKGLGGLRKEQNLLLDFLSLRKTTFLPSEISGHQKDARESMRIEKGGLPFRIQWCGQGAKKDVCGERNVNKRGKKIRR